MIFVNEALRFFIANLWADDRFTATFRGCDWDFERLAGHTALPDFDDGRCRNTYVATYTVKPPATMDDAAGSLLDACLVLSFATGRCVVPDASGMLRPPDCFPAARAIVGFAPLGTSVNLNTLLSGLAASEPAFDARRLRLTFSHWLSALSCFSLEDLATFAFVIMDVVKQCEIAVGVKSAKPGRELEYSEGMTSASNRCGIAPLSKDYKDMRNDLLHAGKLSDKRFVNKPISGASAPKTKGECASVVADVLNWIDRYVMVVLSVPVPDGYVDRWKGDALAAGLPAISL
jgi:hypothetical protein